MIQTKCSLLDPRGQPSGIFGRSSMAPRPNSLDHKTIFLVDVGFPGGDGFWAEVIAWFSKRMPSVTTVLKYKQGDIYQDDPVLWTEAKEEADAVIFGVAG